MLAVYPECTHGQRLQYHCSWALSMQAARLATLHCTALSLSELTSSFVLTPQLRKLSMMTFITTSVQMP